MVLHVVFMGALNTVRTHRVSVRHFNQGCGSSISPVHIMDTLIIQLDPGAVLMLSCQADQMGQVVLLHLRGDGNQLSAIVNTVYACVQPFLWGVKELVAHAVEVVVAGSTVLI